MLEEYTPKTYRAALKGAFLAQVDRARLALDASMYMTPVMLADGTNYKDVVSQNSAKLDDNIRQINEQFSETASQQREVKSRQITKLGGLLSMLGKKQ